MPAEAESEQSNHDVNPNPAPNVEEESPMSNQPLQGQAISPADSAANASNGGHEVEVPIQPAHFGGPSSAATNPMYVSAPPATAAMLFTLLDIQQAMRSIVDESNM